MSSNPAINIKFAQSSYCLNEDDSVIKYNSHNFDVPWPIPLLKTHLQDFCQKRFIEDTFSTSSCYKNILSHNENLLW